MPLASDVTNQVPATDPITDQSTVVWVPDEFHERLTIQQFDDINDVRQFYTDNYHVLSGNFGVLKFMYTVMLTKVLTDIFIFYLEFTENFTKI